MPPSDSWHVCDLYLRGARNAPPLARGAPGPVWHRIGELYRLDFSDSVVAWPERVSEFVSEYRPAETFVLAVGSGNDRFRFDHYVEEEPVRVLMFGLEEANVWSAVEGDPEPWERTGLFSDVEALERARADPESSESDRILLDRVLTTRQPALGTAWPALDARRAGLAAASAHGLPTEWATGSRAGDSLIRMALKICALAVAAFSGSAALAAFWFAARSQDWQPYGRTGAIMAVICIGMALGARSVRGGHASSTTNVQTKARRNADS